MAHTVQVNLHDAQIEALFMGKIRREVSKVVNEGKRLSKARTPRHTGNLARSIVGDVDRVGVPDGFLRGWWGTGARHAMWVHDGTGIYGPRATAIRSRSGKGLSFTPYRLVGPVAATPRGGRRKKRTLRRVVVPEVRGVPRTPFLTEPFKIVMLANGVPFTVHRESLRSLPF